MLTVDLCQDKENMEANNIWSCHYSHAYYAPMHLFRYMVLLQGSQNSIGQILLKASACIGAELLDPSGVPRGWEGVCSPEAQNSQVFKGTVPAGPIP